MMQWVKDFLAPGRRSEIAWWAVILLGISLRVRQYAADRSLWYDEAALVLNLVRRGFGGLIQPLDYNQASPIGFLYIEKAILLLLGNKDYVLRFFPLFTGLISIYLMYRLAREYVGMSGLLALVLFAISWPLIYYSTDAKQYSSDVLVSTLLIFLSLRAMRKEAGLKDILALDAAGILSIWLSHPAIFILGAAGLLLAIEKLRQKNFARLAWILGSGVLWIANFGMTYLVSLRQAMDNSYLMNYWLAYFMPLPPWGHLDWFSRSYLSLLAIAVYINGFPAWTFLAIGTLLALAGIVAFFITDRNIVLLSLLVSFLVLLAAAFQKYPIYGRFILFLLPLLFLLMAKGLDAIYSFTARWNRTTAQLAGGLIALVLVWQPVSTSFQYFLSPYMGEDIKPVMAYIHQKSKPHDVIYVYYGSRYAFEYYAPSFDLVNDRVIFGIASRDDPGQYITDVNQLKGRPRVWVVFSHICSSCRIDELDYYLQHLNQVGKQKARFQSAGAVVYLYDFSP